MAIPMFNLRPIFFWVQSVLLMPIWKTFSLWLKPQSLSKLLHFLLFFLYTNMLGTSFSSFIYTVGLEVDSKFVK